MRTKTLPTFIAKTMLLLLISCYSLYSQTIPDVIKSDTTQNNITYIIRDCITEGSCNLALDYLEQAKASEAVGFELTKSYFTKEVLDIILCLIENNQYPQATELIKDHTLHAVDIEDKILYIHYQNMIYLYTEASCQAAETRSTLVQLLKGNIKENKYLYFIDMLNIQCLTMDNNYVESIKTLIELVSTYPTKATDIKYNLANIYLQIDKEEEACDLLKQISDNKTDSEIKYYSMTALANLEIGNGNLDVAKDILADAQRVSQTIGINKNIGFVFYLLADIHILEGAQDSAMHYALKGIDISIEQNDKKTQRDCSMIILEMQRMNRDYDECLKIINKYDNGIFSGYQQEEVFLTAAIESFDFFNEHRKASNYRERKIKVLQKAKQTSVSSLKVLENINIEKSIENENLKNSKLSLEIKSKNDQKIRKAFIVIFILANLLLLTIIFFYNLINKKNKMKLNETHELNTALKLQRSELNIKNKQLQQEINSNIKLQEFANIVSHDLKSPLVKIGELIKIFKSKNPGSLNDIHYLDLIESTTASLSLFINSLLDFAKIKRIKMELKSTDLPALLNRVLAKATPLGFDQSNIHYHNIPNYIYCNKILIEQLFQNLITNAVRSAAPDRPLIINISAKKEQNQWLLEVRDNGSGIEDDIIRSLMNRSYNTQLTADNYKGHGLGFNIIMYAVESHGGELDIKSEVGQGTVISFTINQWDDFLDVHKDGSLKLDNNVIMEH